MKISDTGIILSITKHQEKDGIVAIFTQKHGIYKGFVKNIVKNRGKFEIGNKVEIDWYARLPEHLGRFSNCDAIKHNASLFFDEPMKLRILQCVCELFSNAIAEREPHPELYHVLDEFLSHMTACMADKLLHEYIILELSVLSHIGFGLELNECVATGSADDLIYVSPKSGRAVSEMAGEPYKDRLLILPKFLLDAKHSADNVQIIDGLNLTKYFLEQHLTLPMIREQLV